MKTPTLATLTVSLWIAGSTAWASDSLYDQFKGASSRPSVPEASVASEADATSPTCSKPFAAGFGGKRGGRMMKMCDTNGDGKLDDSERAAMKEKMKSHRAEIIKKFDKNGDGVLDKTERPAVREAMKARRAERLKKFDKDGDGKLSEQERTAARAEGAKTHGKKPGAGPAPDQGGK